MELKRKEIKDIPKGIEFEVKGDTRKFIFLTDKSRGDYGWICYKHPDGQWVTLKKISDDKIEDFEKTLKMQRLLEFLN